MFTQNCYIKKNTKYLRDRLSSFGYKLNHGKAWGKYLACFKIKDTEECRFVATPETGARPTRYWCQARPTASLVLPIHKRDSVAPNLDHGALLQTKSLRLRNAVQLARCIRARAAVADVHISRFGPCARDEVHLAAHQITGMCGRLRVGI